jgi:hypothetical protein
VGVLIAPRMTVVFVNAHIVLRFMVFLAREISQMRSKNFSIFCER